MAPRGRLKKWKQRRQGGNRFRFRFYLDEAWTPADAVFPPVTSMYSPPRNAMRGDDFKGSAATCCKVLGKLMVPRITHRQCWEEIKLVPLLSIFFFQSGDPLQKEVWRLSFAYLK